MRIRQWPPGHRPFVNGVCLVAPLLVASLLAGCGEGKSAAEKKAPPPPPAVVVAEVVQRTVPIRSEFVARTDAQDTVEIRARVQAFLEGQHFTEGTMVKKDQVLFTLDKREYEAQLKQGRAQLAKAQADLAFAKEQATVDTAKANLDVARAVLNKTDTDVRRLKPLAEQRAVPQQDYDNALANQQAARADVEARKAALETARVNQKSGIEQAEAAIEAANATIAQAELNISYCTIRSPIAGLIGKREVAPGNLVGRLQATLLATVSRLDPLRVYLSVSEADYLRFQASRKKGQTRRDADIELLLADGTVFPHKGRFIIADRAIDLATGTLSLIAEFPNPDMLVRPGQFGRALVAAEERPNAILVPQRAIQEVQGLQSVLVVGEDNTVVQRTITPAESVGEDLIVTAGVKPGERVIVEGLQKARPGGKVTPTLASSGPAETKPPGDVKGTKSTGDSKGK
jgi:membrane fusion protein, multidrug efflux system